jgi:hypothetical protein
MEVAMFYDIEQIKEANEKIGHHFFSKGAVKAFKDITYPDLWNLPDGGALFIHSIKPPHGKRLYKVRRVFSDGIVTVNSRGSFATLNRARAEAEEWAQEIAQEAK